MIHIDGSQGEGGGQILRSALALSTALGRPFTITSIRANRPKPGLMRQHITAVEAAAAICAARTQGASAGSGELVFEPGPVRGGTHRFSIGTAGSTTLVLQAILPPLLFAPEPSEITIDGGTHARWAPPYDFFERALLPLLNRLGASVSATLDRHGFYPAGGGCVRVHIDPARAPTPLVLDARGEITARAATVLLSKLPRSIAERELERVRERLGWDLGPACITHADNALSPGNTISLELACEHVTEVFSAIGEQGKPAESVADEAVDMARDYLAAGAPVGRYLADQLMAPLAIASARGAGECGFLTMPLSRHAATNAEVVEAFLPRASRSERVDTGVRWRVRV
jgi:RNA 3'-terminal phosphate cyclase (ATP)